MADNNPERKREGIDQRRPLFLLTAQVATKQKILHRGGIALAVVGLAVIIYCNGETRLPNCGLDIANGCNILYEFGEFMGVLMLGVGGIGYTVGQNLVMLELRWSRSKEEKDCGEENVS